MKLGFRNVLCPKLFVIWSAGVLGLLDFAQKTWTIAIIAAGFLLSL